jgi:hypothetical protein
MALSFKELHNKVARRIWYSRNGAFAFLVDAPHTFGASQLVVAMRFDKEGEAFLKVSCHIATCIGILRTSLPSPADHEWESLAEYTRSSGSYKKTLVLRVSADERKNTYKVHLVPYFKSHLDATSKLYQVTHDKGPKEKGGLLHWLGQREVILDYDMRAGRDDKLVEARIKSFRLDQLALKLRRNRESGLTNRSSGLAGACVGAASSLLTTRRLRPR